MSLIVLFGVVFIAIAWHELGHYWTARAFGIGIQEYDVGIGPKLFQVRLGPTRFTWRLLPIGGYVDPADWDDVEDPEYLKKLDPAERAMVKQARGWFSNHPLHQQLMMLIAGPAFNVILAVVVFSFVGPAKDYDAGLGDLVRSAWNVNARSQVAGIPLAQNTSLVDYLAGFHQALRLGPAYVVRIFATLNMGLAVLNLLPMLPLDGGRIVWSIFMSFYQGDRRGKALLARRRKAMKVLMALSIVGLVVVIAGQFMI